MPGRLLSRSTFHVYSRGTSRTSLGAVGGSGETGVDADSTSTWISNSSAQVVEGDGLVRRLEAAIANARRTRGRGGRQRANVPVGREVLQLLPQLQAVVQLSPTYHSGQACSLHQYTFSPFVHSIEAAIIPLDAMHLSNRSNPL